MTKILFYLQRKRWRGCLAGLSCFGKQKGGKRIVPSSRMPDTNLQNGPQAGALPNQATGIALSLYAPPSSPASFSHSALPSTAPSPNCYLSSNSPERPTSNMYVTGPYANETQLVSPPVFSTFTTEPSTAPLTPPPELAHLTTPSSPDVPYARFLSSSSIRQQWDPTIPSEEPAYSMSGPSHSNGLQTTGASKSRQDSNFFCPETFAQFYLDQSSLSHTGGRLSISKESDAYNSNPTNGHQNWQSRTCKPDAEELEAYRASFGFSADDIVSTTQYVEIVDVMEPFNITTPFSSSKQENNLSGPEKGVDTEERREEFSMPQLKEIRVGNTEVAHSGVPGSFISLQGEL